MGGVLRGTIGRQERVELSPSEPSTGGPSAPILDGADYASLDLPEQTALWWLAKIRQPGNDRLYLATHTYDLDRFVPVAGRPLRDRVGVQAFRRDHLRWYDVLRAATPQPDVLVGGEPHRSGSLHGHVLVAMPAGARWERPARWWFEHHGFARYDEVRDPEAAGAYAAKYVVKELALVGIGRAGCRLVIT